MEISVLGPIRVTLGGRPLRLPAKQQILLVVLALQPNRTISTGQLVQALWGEDPPESAVKTLQTHVFQLRRLLAMERSDDPSKLAIVTDGRGYRLEVDALTIDSERFQRRVDDARSASRSDPAMAAAVLSEALALWRGEGLPDVGDDPVATAELFRLGELRASAVDDLVRIRLALGDAEAVIPELRRELSESPYRERLWIDLMLVLARARRRAEALRAYRDAEQALRRELDVEPGAELRELARLIREGDDLVGWTPDEAVPVKPAQRETEQSRHEGSPMAPAPPDAAHHGTAAVSVTGAPPDEPDARPVRERSRGGMVLRRATAVALSVVVLAVVITMGQRVLQAAPTVPVATIAPVSSTAVQPSSMPIVADSVAWMSPAGSVMAASPVGALPDGLAVGAGSVWVANTTDGTVTRLSRTTNRVNQTIRVGADPTSVTFAFGAVWVADSGERTVSRIDPVTDAVVATVTVGIAPAGIASDGRWVWVTNRLAGTLSRIDPSSDAVATFPVGQTPLGIAADADALWVADFESGVLVRVDPASGTVVGRIHVGNGPAYVAATSTSVWVTNSRDGTVSRVDTATGTVQAVVPVGQDPGGIALDRAALWVPVGSPAGLVRIDTQTNVAEHFPLASSPRSVALDGSRPVFTVRAAAGNHRGGTLRVVSSTEDFPNSPDPAFAEFNAVTLVMLTNDGLLGYERVGGPDGLTVVPDLAEAMPTSPDGGLTYRFQLRPGIEYSTGQPVRATDVVRSIERAMLAPFGNVSFGNLVGAGTCTNARSCDLSRAVTADDRTGTVTFRLRQPDPNFLAALAWPTASIVPADTPLAESSTPLPATGPYMFERFGASDGIRLVRNPRFVAWSSEAQPDGYPDAIEWRVVSNGQDGSLTVQSGAADWVADPLTAQRLAYLATALPAQLHVAASTQTFFEFMNTTIPPFNDPNVRRAVNLATDRQAVVAAYGGELQARITCQVVPPSFAGYVPYCPYTVDPSGDGVWRGPDLAAARSLIDAAGVRGESVTVYGLDLPGHREVAQYFASLLGRLGFRATATLMTLDGFWGSSGVLTHPSRIQMAGYWFATSEPTAAQMIPGAFTCPDYPGVVYQAYPSEFCDRALDAMVTKALASEAQGDSAGANALWATIDQRIVDESPAVAAFNPTDVEFVSSRVGGFQHHPVLQVLLDQLWVQ
jgi:peptide/nickel transport system substrate-binding protein